MKHSMYWFKISKPYQLWMCPNFPRFPGKVSAPRRQGQNARIDPPRPLATHLFWLAPRSGPRKYLRLKLYPYGNSTKCFSCKCLFMYLFVPNDCYFDNIFVALCATFGRSNPASCSYKRRKVWRTLQRQLSRKPKRMRQPKKRCHHTNIHTLQLANEMWDSILPLQHRGRCQSCSHA